MLCGLDVPVRSVSIATPQRLHRLALRSVESLARRGAEKGPQAAYSGKGDSSLAELNRPIGLLRLTTRRSGLEVFCLIVFFPVELRSSTRR